MLQTVSRFNIGVSKRCKSGFGTCGVGFQPTTLQTVASGIIFSVSPAMAAIAGAWPPGNWKLAAVYKMNNENSLFKQYLNIVFRI